MLELLQRCYDAGDIELGTYSGKYCVSCEEYYTDDELLAGGLCPIHRTPVDEYEEENYFFRLSRFQDRLLDWYAAHPDAIKPEHRVNEALGPDPGRPARLLRQPHQRVSGASRCRGTRPTSRTSGSTPSPTTCRRSASATPSRTTPTGGRSTTT